MRQGVRKFERSRNFPRLADCKSAIRQHAILRYETNLGSSGHRSLDILWSLVIGDWSLVIGSEPPSQLRQHSLQIGLQGQQIRAVLDRAAEPHGIGGGEKAAHDFAGPAL